MAMAFLPLLDFDTLFLSDPVAKVVPYGVKTYTSNKQINTFMDVVFRKDTGGLEYAASCTCGNLEGNYYIGIICKNCNTTVKEPFASDLRFKLWIELPEYTSPVLHPVAYRVFNKWLGTYERQQLLDLILNSQSVLSQELMDNVGVGFENFYRRFDEIMHYLLNEYKPLQRKNMAKRSEGILQFIQMYRAQMFVRHLPILNSDINILTTKDNMSLVDSTAKYIAKVMIELSNLAYIYNTSKRPDSKLEAHTSKVYYSYLEYISDIVYSKLTTKPGFIRRHMLGTRLHFSFRSVITPIVGASYPDEIHLSWRVAISVYKLEILNLLMNRYGHSMSTALERWHNAKFIFDPTIHAILNILNAEFLESSIVKEISHVDVTGMPTIFGRNPTLNHGSVQCLFITKFKDDITDDTVSISPMNLSAYNADFDGDAMYGAPLKEMGALPHYLNLHPSTLFITSDKLEVTSDINMTDQSYLALQSWLSGEE